MRLLLLVLDPGPHVLARTIPDRVDRMLASGFLAEVEHLHAAGYHEGHKAMRSLGYRQLLPVVRGLEGSDAPHRRLDLAELLASPRTRGEITRARDAIVVATRQFARRQRTYFRHQLPAEDVVHLTDPRDVPWDRVRAILTGRGGRVGGS